MYEIVPRYHLVMFRNGGYILIGKTLTGYSVSAKLGISLIFTDPYIKLRILLYSSFTPFLVVFTHAVAANNENDVELLTQVLSTLEAPRKNTEVLNRLYQVCKVFLEFAKAFVTSRQASFGIYNVQEDSFTFSMLDGDGANVSYQVPNYGVRDRSDNDLESMTGFLGAYLGENSSMNSLWNMDFSRF